MNKLSRHVRPILGWGEQYLKTDLSYLIRGGSWLVSAQILTTFLNFVTAIIFGHLISKNDYGNYKYVLSVFALLSAFSLTGMRTAVIQAVARGFDGALEQGVKLAQYWSWPAILISTLGAFYYFYNENNFLGTSLLVIAIAMPFTSSWGLFAAFVNGKKDFRRLSTYEFFDNLFPLLAVMLVLIFTNKVIYLIIAFLGVSIVSSYYFYKRTINILKPAQSQDPELERYGIKLSLLNVVGLITQHIDKVIVFTSLGAIELAVYSFAVAFPDQIRALIRNLGTLMVPKFTERSMAGGHIQYIRKSWQLILLLLAILIAYVASAPFLYSLFFPNYPESVYYSQVLALMILSSVALIPNSLFIARKQEDKLAKSTIGSSLVQIAILFPAAHWGGLLGVCLARVASSYAMTFISFYLLGKTSTRTPGLSVD